MTTVATALRAAERALGEEGAIEAQVLLSHALAKPRAWLYAHSEELVEAAVQRRLLESIERRRRGEPVAHIVGRREFWSLELSVTAATLIPRPDTERLVELALARIPLEQNISVLDVGTGTGAIALAIAAERPQAEVTAVDASRQALEVARRNAAAHGLDRVRFLHSDWFSAVVGQRFELIVGNPPYLAEDDPHLERGDLRFEPREALVSGKDGLDAIRQIIEAAPSHLGSGAWLLLEHGFDQAPAVRDLFADQGLVQIETALDWEGRQRVTCGRAKSIGTG
jgi:release factor glutamine methyltransferase